MPSQHAYSAVFLSIYPSMINHSTNQETRIIRIYFVDVLMHPTSIVKNERKKNARCQSYKKSWDLNLEFVTCYGIHDTHFNA